MVDVVGYLSDGKVPCKFDTDVNAPALAECKVGYCTVLYYCTWYVLVCCCKPYKNRKEEDIVIVL